jgi:hypothetical protein
MKVKKDDNIDKMWELILFALIGMFGLIDRLLGE